jgi:VanZ family protein
VTTVSSSRARSFSLWAPVLVYMVLIFSVSGMASAPLPEQVSDKLGHLVAYFGLGVLAVRAAAGGLPARVTGRVAVLTAVIACGYGASDEIHQLFVLGRSADVADWYADSAGALLGLCACWAWGMIAVRADV